MTGAFHDFRWLWRWQDSPAWREHVEWDIILWMIISFSPKGECLEAQMGSIFITVETFEMAIGSGKSALGVPGTPAARQQRGAQQKSPSRAPT